jgi:redox-sensing transcriptional repressor
MKGEVVPEVVILRLPLYLRTLYLLEKDGMQVVSSKELASKLGLTPAQIRKDLSYFGKFGKQGKGYNIKSLQEELCNILGLREEWKMVLVGVGRLGRAILSYGGFAPQGFKIVAAFDIDRNQIGKGIGGLVVQDIRELSAVVTHLGIQLGIVAVPPPQAQGVIDEMVRSGIKGILNYTPIIPKVPPGIKVRNIDPVTALQSMTYFLKV